MFAEKPRKFFLNSICYVTFEARGLQFPMKKDFHRYFLIFLNIF